MIIQGRLRLVVFSLHACNRDKLRRRIASRANSKHSIYAGDTSIQELQCAPGICQGTTQVLHRCFEWVALHCLVHSDVLAILLPSIVIYAFQERLSNMYVGQHSLDETTLVPKTV